MRSADEGWRSWLSAAEALKLLEIARACLSCGGEGDFRRLFPRVQELVPFDRAIAISGHLVAGGGVAASRAVNVSYPGEFVHEYVARGFFRVDPVMQRALATGRAQHCSDASERPREVLALCRDFGLQDGYTIGFAPNAGCEGSLFSFKGASTRNTRRAAALLELLTPHLQLAFARVAGSDPSRAGRPALSAREREVARWLGQGKSSWEVSVILRISERTVNFHVANLLRKLDAANRAQAVAIATRLGLLEGG